MFFFPITDCEELTVNEGEKDSTQVGFEVDTLQLMVGILTPKLWDHFTEEEV